MLKNIKNIYFLGIGGIGMSALALWSFSKGFNVQGWDDEPRTDLIQTLVREGIIIYGRQPHLDNQSLHLNLDQNVINSAWNKDNTIVVYTSAIPNNHQYFKYFQKREFKMYKRAELLEFISKDYKVIAVAGTHGKTTISIMLAHILRSSGINCNAFFGGISKNYNSNVLIGNSDIMIVEADEYDKSFLKLNPFISLVSSLDKDHGDIYKDIATMIDYYQEFIDKTESLVIANKKLAIPFDYSYSIDTSADFYVSDISYSATVLNFVIHFPNNLSSKITLSFGCNHNIENVLAAASLAFQLGCSPGQISQAFISFQGIERRFEYHINTDKFILIDDYAHHPEELRALIKSLRDLYQEREIFLIFQPHLFSRTREFKDQFSEVLSSVDKLILLDIYPARETPINGVNSENLLKKITLKNKWYSNFKNVQSILLKESPSLLVTAGAGDIYKLLPIIKSILV